MALKTLSKRQAAKKGLVNPGGKPMSKRQLAKRGYVVKDFSSRAGQPPKTAMPPAPPGPTAPPPIQAKREDYARSPMDFSDTFEYRDPGGHLGQKAGL